MALIPKGLSVRPVLCDPVPLGLPQRSWTSAAQRSRPKQAFQKPERSGNCCSSQLRRPGPSLRPPASLRGRASGAGRPALAATPQKAIVGVCRRIDFHVHLRRLRFSISAGARQKMMSESGTVGPRIEPATDADVRPAAEVAVRSLRWTKGPRRSTWVPALPACVALLCRMA